MAFLAKCIPRSNAKQVALRDANFRSNYLLAFAESCRRSSAKPGSYATRTLGLCAAKVDSPLGPTHYRGTPPATEWPLRRRPPASKPTAKKVCYPRPDRAAAARKSSPTVAENSRAMLTGQIPDQIWRDFWSGGVCNPISGIEQITCLIFIHTSTSYTRLRRTRRDAGRAHGAPVLPGGLRRKVPTQRPFESLFFRRHPEGQRGDEVRRGWRRLRSGPY